MSPARSMSLWLTTSASEGASFSVERKNRETRMLLRVPKTPYSTGPWKHTRSRSMKLLAKWRARKRAFGDDDVYVSERFGVRSLHIGSDTVQSSMRVSRPNDLELSYTRSMMAFLLFMPEPREILMIGLGGGSLAKFVLQHLTNTRTRAVEVNPRVVTVARQ